MYIEKCHQMAKLASLAYLDRKDAMKAYQQEGYRFHKLINIKGAQCHIIWNKHEYVLCFRGTEPDEFSDILADLNAVPDKAELAGYVHDGFQTEVDKVWKEIVDHIDVYLGDRKLFLTGHSLGGAMATIAASRLMDIVSALYTYGSPRVGTKSFVSALKVTHYRHVNNNDIVTCVPPYPLYFHHSESRYMDYRGIVRKMNRFQKIKDRIMGMLSSWTKFKVGDPIADHDISAYIKNTGKNV